MPIARVTAKCTDSNYNSFMEYTLLEDNLGTFYIDKASGDVFLVNNAGYQSLAQICPTPCSLSVSADLSNLAVDPIEMEVKISGVGVEQVLVFDTDVEYTETGQVLQTINDNSEEVWFRVLNVQPRETKLVRETSGSVLFLTGYKEEQFINRAEAGAIISDSNLEADTELEVNHHVDDGGDGEGGSGGKWRGATIALAVILSLIILAFILVVVFYKRGPILEKLSKIRSRNEKYDSTDNSGLSEKATEHAAVEVKPERASRNNGFFNLQSVTIQTNNPRGGSAGGSQQQTSLMREMSTELEKRLETRDRQEPVRAKPPNVAKSGPGVRGKGPAPIAPSKGGIKFNEGVEVVEVENKHRDSISSVRTSDSDNSFNSQHEDVTRI